MSSVILTYGETVLRYFNPSRSPFYAIIAIAVISLEFADSDLWGIKWCVVALIMLLVLSIAMKIALATKAHMSKAEYIDQLSFSRSICVSAALLALWYFSRKFPDSLSFCIVIVACSIQIVTFLLYIWARADSPDELQDTNYVQLGLVTTTLFLGALFLLKGPTVPSPPSPDLVNASFAALPVWGRLVAVNAPAAMLALMWLLCLSVWWRLIGTLVEFTFLRRK